MSQVLPQDAGSRDYSGDLDIKSGKDVAPLTSGRLSAAEGESADQMLEHLGYKPELSRNRSTAQVAFMSFVLASIPYGLATTLIYPLVGGGPVNIIWGWLLVSCIIVCVAASLGEITSVYPTAGGRRHVLAPVFHPQGARSALVACTSWRRPSFPPDTCSGVQLHT